MDEYERLEPVQWPVRADGRATFRFFGEGGFFTPDRRGRMVAVDAPVPAPALATAPFVLNTGRVRDHWHTMTRTGRSARLSAHLAEPFCEIAEEDAARLAIAPADLVRVETAHGSAILRALVTDRQAPGRLFAPMHWTREFAPAGRIGGLAQSARDPHSGQPALKGTPAGIARFAARWHGFAVTRQRPDPQMAEYAALARTMNGWRIELAGLGEPDPQALASALFGGGEEITRTDGSAGRHAWAAFDEGRLLGALWIAPVPVTVSRAFACAFLGEASIEGPARLRLLAGRPGPGRPDPGAIVCSCYCVGARDITRSIEGGARDVAAIGRATKAGTNCGSCRSELRACLKRAAPTLSDGVARQAFSAM